MNKLLDGRKRESLFWVVLIISKALWIWQLRIAYGSWCRRYKKWRKGTCYWLWVRCITFGGAKVDLLFESKIGLKKLKTELNATPVKPLVFRKKGGCVKIRFFLSFPQQSEDPGRSGRRTIALVATARRLHHPALFTSFYKTKDYYSAYECSLSKGYFLFYENVVSHTLMTLDPLNP